MKYAVISDIHANEAALREVLADAFEQGAERVVCLGDAVGYGPCPAEVIALLKVSASMVIAGNHDDAVSGRNTARNFIELAKGAVSRHRATLSKVDIAWLKSLPYTCSFAGAVATHGDFVAPERFGYIDGVDAALENFQRCGEQLLFCGHTHVPRIYVVGSSGNVYDLSPQDFELEIGKRYIVNPGSVGYPRESDGQCYSSYVLWDSSSRTVVFRRLPFCVSSVMQRGAERPVRRRVLAVLAAMALVAVGLGFWVFGARGTEEWREALRLERRELPVGADLKYIRPNLKISRGPVLLQIFYLDREGRRISAVRDTVSHESARRRKIPPNTVKVVLEVLKLDGRDAPVVTTFSPEASAR